MGFSTFLHDNFVPHIPRSQEPVTRNSVSADVGPQNSNKAEKTGEISSVHSTLTNTSRDSSNHLHRSLRSRHVQLLGIGATIGSALFVAIGSVVVYGPLNLFLAFLVWSIPILCITISTAEMVTYLPITSPFVRMAGRCCDNALEVMTAWNFWFLCCAQIPFEVVTVNSILHYWRDDFSAGIPLAVQVVLYFLINIFGVAIYGEVEFWLSLGKVILAVALIFFTFITMVGGNPKNDAFGFRYWRDPGPLSAFEYPGKIGYFRGFLACLIRATFTFAGPEYVSLVASETVNPRKTLPSAYKQVFIRLTIFFIGGALCCGVLVASNDPLLIETRGTTKPGAGGSPYVIAMQNLGIKVFPDVVNALLVTSAFSAGNSYTYCSSRTLYGFALDGYAPRFLTATTKSGIPMYCMLISLAWAFISFLQLGEGASKVLDWIVNLITSCQLINFSILCLTYCCFYRAMKAQGIDRRSLPFRGWFQPWLAIFGGGMAFTMIFVGTYETFMPGGWDIKTFLFSYLMIFIDVGIFVIYKLVRWTKWKKSAEVDLVTGLKEVEEHEAWYYEQLEEKRMVKENGEVKQNWWQRICTLVFGSEL